MPQPPALRDALRVKPGSRVRLDKLDPNATFGHDKASSVAKTAKQMERLRDLQDRIWAERSTPSSSSSRASTPPARTARSPRSWTRSTRRAAR